MPFFFFPSLLYHRKEIPPSHSWAKSAATRVGLAGKANQILSFFPFGTYRIFFLETNLFWLSKWGRWCLERLGSNRSNLGVSPIFFFLPPRQSSIIVFTVSRFSLFYLFVGLVCLEGGIWTTLLCSGTLQSRTGSTLLVAPLQTYSGTLFFFFCCRSNSTFSFYRARFHKSSEKKS